jgi:hypothetical protein
MNTQEILHQEPKLFAEVEDWKSLLELRDKIQEIKDHWFSKATTALQNRLRTGLPPEWRLDSKFGGFKDSRVYLAQFGPRSLALAYGWDYELHLIIEDFEVFDADKLNTLLQAQRFSTILQGFERIDRSFEMGSKAMCYRNFSFGSPHDGNIPPEELAWYAGNRTEEFVDQAMAQLERFTKSQEITRLLVELNREGRKEP